MANIRAAKKAILQIASRTKINKARRSRVRGFVRKVEEAISNGDKETASAALVVAQAELARASQKGVFHQNTVSRKTSRLAQKVAQL